MRLTRTSGSVGGLGGRPPRSTRPSRPLRIVRSSDWALADHALGAGLTMELARVGPGNALDLLHDQLRDRHPRPEDDARRAQINHLQGEIPFEAGVHGRGSEVDQEPNPGSAALALDSCRQAARGIVGVLDRQAHAFPCLGQDERMALEDVARPLVEANSLRVPCQEGAQGRRLRQVEGVGTSEGNDDLVPERQIDRVGIVWAVPIRIVWARAPVVQARG